MNLWELDILCSSLRCKNSFWVECLDVKVEFKPALGIVPQKHNYIIKYINKNSWATKLHPTAARYINKLHLSDKGAQ